MRWRGVDGGAAAGATTSGPVGRPAPRLGAPARDHVDAVVVGSGFGAAVSAYRLATGGQDVLVLERGRAYPPGSFARSPAELSRAFWEPAAGLHGLFDVLSFRHCDGLVSSGLGGGSLIYANVLLRKDEHWFVEHEPLPKGGYEEWPITRADLDPHYDEVERMLRPVPFPFGHGPYDQTPKTRAMRDASERLGLDWQLPPLAVSFAPDAAAAPGVALPITPASYGSIHASGDGATVARRTCRLCGECDIGCNDGSKNSLDHTYLSAAAYAGADVRTRHEVIGFRPGEHGGFVVEYRVLDPELEGSPVRLGTLPSYFVSCDRLLLGAGTFGTTQLLLRSRDRYPQLRKAFSPMLGQRFSGNGDLLTFLLDARNTARGGDGAAAPTNPGVLAASRGPVITSAIRLPDQRDPGPVNGSRPLPPGRGAYIEDGGYPSFLDWIVHGVEQLPQLTLRAILFAARRTIASVTGSADSGLSREIASLIGDGRFAAGSLPLLAMGRDVPDGVIRLDNGSLDVSWSTATSAAYFERVRATMQELAAVLGAGYSDSPSWLRKRVITVHPLGGAPIGHDVTRGVCDADGQVFGVPGLYVVDGAAMPGPVGANPALTIAAMADRVSTRLLDASPLSRRGPAASERPTTDGSDPSAPPTAPVRAATGGGTAGTSVGGAPTAQPTSLNFTETMRGFWSEGQQVPAVGAAEGRRANTPLSFRLKIAIEDVRAFILDPLHGADASGRVTLGGEQVPVSAGWFNLFVPGDAPDHRLMRYRLHLTTAAGEQLTLLGEKDIADDPAIAQIDEVWADTTTLAVHLHRGHLYEDGDLPPPGSLAGTGVLRISRRDFLRQLTTIRATGPHPERAIAQFGEFFAGQLWDVFGIR